MNSRMLMTAGAVVLAVGGALAAVQTADAGSTPTAAPLANTDVPSAAYFGLDACSAARSEFVNEFRTVGPCSQGPETYSAYVFLIPPDESGTVTSPSYASFETCQSRRHVYTNQFRTTTACTRASADSGAYTFTLL